jgi:hypothetical protein
MALDIINTRPSTPAMRKILMVLLLCLPLTGCYQTNQEVVTSAVAENMPYKSNKVSLQADGDMFLSRSKSSNDYHFRHTKPDDPNDRTGTLRVMSVKGSIFAVQTKYDDENSYEILFCKITAKNFEIMEPKSDEAVQALARRYNVNLTTNIKTGNDLSGDPREILNFLKAHKDLEFQKFKESVPAQ